MAHGAGKIKHVVYIVQENRSFDDLFQGYPGADTVSRARPPTGKTIKLKAVSLKLQVRHRPFPGCDDRGVRWSGEDSGNGLPDGRLRQGESVRRSESRPVRLRAAQRSPRRTLRWRTSGHWPTKPSIAARREFRRASIRDRGAGEVVGESSQRRVGLRRRQARHVDTIGKNRTGYGPKIPPCFDYTTLGDELDAAKLSWRFYTSRTAATRRATAAFGRAIKPYSTFDMGRIGKRT